MFSSDQYQALLETLFRRFPSVQQVPFSEGYKPGLERMRAFDRLLGHPSASFRSIHVAGTNGKGSVSSMLASALAARGARVGLYTSPHLLDFRERMRIAGEPAGEDGAITTLVPREYVFDFITRYQADFERLSLSFFEITTGMAFRWFADSGVDWAVVEVGLGGRLDSTNILTPELAVVTSIGLDHCALLGDTLGEIAFEKAGIFKPGVPALVGRRVPDTEPVFRDVAARVGAPLFFADDPAPEALPAAEIAARADLQGAGQRDNIRTVLRALELLFPGAEPPVDALCHTASRMDFRGRWERLCERPEVICDIGHNAAALAGNFRRLEASGKPLVIVYAVMADKDLGAILPLMPRRASYIFTTPKTLRARPAEDILARFLSYRSSSRPDAQAIPDVAAAVAQAMKIAGTGGLIYIGGSTFAVAEAIPLFRAGRYLNNS